MTITRMLQKQGARGPVHDQQGVVSIGEAWDSLDLDLNLMEDENKSDYPSMSAI